MLGDISLATNIYLVTGYTDMRKSIDGLCAIIMKNFNQEPDGHSIYLFCGKRCDRIKVLPRYKKAVRKRKGWNSPHPSK